MSFEVHPIQENKKVAIRCESSIIDHRNVKSSSRISEKRYVIKTKMTIGSHEWSIELTLANRDSMGFRMLLGREAMDNQILVDPANTLLLGAYSKGTINEMYQNISDVRSGLIIGLLASKSKVV